MRTAICVLLSAGLVCAADPAFEVATLKEVKPVPPFPVVPGRALHGTVTLTNVTLAECLRYAYKVTSDDQIAGPAWVKSQEALFEIVGKAPDGTATEQLRLMTRKLLAARFQLTLHEEQREIPYWALLVDKKGAKLRESSDKSGDIRTELRAGRIVLPRASMATLMLAIGRLATGRPIVDLTGMKGSYDVNLEWTPMKQKVPETADGADGGLPAGPAFLDAMQEQLGLKLEMRKGPMNVVVIDRVERKPLAN